MEKITTLNYSDNKIIINGHENVVAPANIVNCLALDDFIILLLDHEALNNDDNIYCYDVQGKLEWIVESFNWNDSHYFTSIYVLKDLNFYGYSINGIEAKIDFKTGKILSTELVK